MAARRKLNESFADIANAPPSPATPVQRHDATPVSLDDAVALNRDDAKPSKRAHVSVYVSVKVQRAIKQLALDRNVRAHDLYLDGLRLIMKEHGLDFDHLNAER